MNIFVYNFLNILLEALMVLIFVRVILSWVPTGLDKVKKFVFELTEPILAPLRKIIPPIAGAIDLSPLVAIVIITILQELLARI